MYMQMLIYTYNSVLILVNLDLDAIYTKGYDFDVYS